MIELGTDRAKTSQVCWRFMSQSKSEAQESISFLFTNQCRVKSLNDWRSSFAFGGQECEPFA